MIASAVMLAGVLDILTALTSVDEKASTSADWSVLERVVMLVVCSGFLSAALLALMASSLLLEQMMMARQSESESRAEEWEHACDSVPMKVGSKDTETVWMLVGE